MPTAPLGVRESTENIPAARRVRDVDETIHYFDPNENPFVLLSKQAGKKSATNSKFEWMEKELPPRSNQINNGGGYTAGATALVVDNGPYFFPNDVVLVVRTGELFLVSSIATNTLTVVRGVGSVSAQALLDNDDLLIVGNSNPENGTLGTERSLQEAFLFNYTQIHRLPFGTSGTEAASNNYGGKDRPRITRENGIWHMLQLEAAFLYGQRNLSTSGGDSTNKPRRYSGGFTYFVTTNVQDAGGTLTEPEFETFTQTVFQVTGAGMSRILFAAPGVMSIIDQLAAGRLRTVPDDKTFGIAVEQWRTSHGTLNIVKHRLLENGPGGTGYGSYALAVDPGKISYVPLQTRDTKLRSDVGTPGDDGWTDEYITEVGFAIRNQTAHGILKNATS